MPGWIPWSRPVDRTKRPVVSTEEVFALLEYTTSQGIAKAKVEILSQEIHKSDEELDLSRVAALYGDLVAETKPINGRRLLDSRDAFRRLSGISTATTIFFVLAVGNYVADFWLADIVEPEEGLYLAERQEICLGLSDTFLLGRTWYLRLLDEITPGQRKSECL